MHRRATIDDATRIPADMPADAPTVTDYAMEYVEPLTHEWQRFPDLKHQGWERQDVFEELARRGLIEGMAGPVTIDDDKGVVTGSQYWFRLRYADDVAKLVEACRAEGHDIPPYDCAHAWALYSHARCARWLVVEGPQRELAGVVTDWLEWPTPAE